MNITTIVKDNEGLTSITLNARELDIVAFALAYCQCDGDKTETEALLQIATKLPTELVETAISADPNELTPQRKLFYDILLGINKIIIAECERQEELTLSPCCGVKFDTDMRICPKCKEHV